MNEIKRIHLGRTSYTISVDAYQELNEYLEAIKSAVGKSSDVIDEVELRMVELLASRGVKGEKVILPADVAFLKEQLGEPRDFKDDGTSDEELEKESEAGAERPVKRLFRDTDNGMIAGVSSGLAAYFGIDAVIIRLLFVLLTFGGGTGILLYVIFWLITPEATTTSEKLQMQGQAVTLDSLKQVVDKADVPGAAQRAKGSFGGVVETLFKVLLAVIGVALIIGAALGALASIMATVFVLFGGAQLGGELVFPVGAREVVTFTATMVSVVLMFLGLILVGVAMVRRRWQLPAWGVAAIIGLIIVSTAIAAGLAPHTVPAVRNRVEALQHEKTVTLPAFDKATLTGDDVRFIYVPDTKTYVKYSYFGKTDVSGIKAEVVDGRLELAAQKVTEPHCEWVCIDDNARVRIYIHAPTLSDVQVSGKDTRYINEQNLPHARYEFRYE
jgi:phage shock protein PspC (stress-responsive transcriptional regulator)